MKSLIALIIALTAGGVGGWSLTAQPAPPSKEAGELAQTINQNKEAKTSDDMPSAEDFVSLRPSLEALPSESLSETELEGLLFMREEEKLARDVYTTLYEKWGLQIFSNIAQSEQTHTEAVRDVLEKYNEPDPVTNDTIGVFTNQELQALYNDLVAKGEKTLEDALEVGVMIEDLDIRDLQNEISATDNQDILLVYKNLIRGSQNHLRSFMSQLTSRGGSYEAQYITPAEFSQIIESEKETGRGQKSGGSSQGDGRGWGRSN